MEQYRHLADGRLVVGCTYCGAPENTRDHVPSRVLLDSPFPENLPVVGACLDCNNGFSQDEQYLACLIESVIAGSTDPSQFRRPSVAEAMRRIPALRARIENARHSDGDTTRFDVEWGRVENVLLKLARGHAAFELSQVCRQKPDSIWYRPLVTLTEQEREEFDACHVAELFGEVGSRGMQRLLVTQVQFQSASGETRTRYLLVNDWVVVQEDRYRYLAVDDGGEVSVRIVISEYLACEVAWAT